MKKVLCLLVILTLAMTMLFVSCNQEEQQGSEQSSEQTSEQVTIPTEPSEGLEFRSSGDGTCALIGIGTCTDTYIVIPDTSPEGDKVTTIQSGCFFNCTDLTSIIIPNTVIEIGNGSISFCTGLTSIELPCSIRKIGYRAFAECTSLESITIPEGVETIGYGLIEGCDNLQSISLPSTFLGFDSDYAGSSICFLSGGSALESITVDPSNPVYHSVDNCLIETATDTMISGCKTSIIPNGVTSISDYAFAGTGLKEIIIPDSVTYISPFAFEGCESFESIAVGSGNKVYHSLNNCVIETQSGELILGSKVGWKNGIIPDSVTRIGDGAFLERDFINIIIPASVTSIGVQAFGFCAELISVNIPDSVTYIGDMAFYECASLTSVTIGSGVTRIGSAAFSECNSLTDIYFSGTEQEWNSIEIDEDNVGIKNATIHYNYVPEE